MNCHTNSGGAGGQRTRHGGGSRYICAAAGDGTIGLMSRQRPPSVTLRVALADARRAGLPFDRAWERALAVTRRTHLYAGNGWEETEATQATWRAAYERAAPTTSDRALAFLGDDPARRSGAA
jgi:hypothetical protein